MKTKKRKATVKGGRMKTSADIMKLGKMMAQSPQLGSFMMKKALGILNLPNTIRNYKK